MPTFIVQGRYTKDAIQGMMAKPEDRGPEVAKLVEAFGGKTHGYYVTFGENDFLIACEGPDEKSCDVRSACCCCRRWWHGFEDNDCDNVS